MEHLGTRDFVLLLLLTTVLASTGATKRLTPPQDGCGDPPETMPLPKLASKQCWLRSVMPTAQLVPGGSPLLHSRRNAQPAATWRDLQRLVHDHPDTPLYIQLSGRVAVDATLIVKNRTAPLVITGPAELLPTGAARHNPAVIIQQSISVLIRQVSFVGFPEGALSVVDSSSATQQERKQLRTAPITSRSPAPAVRLHHVAFINCSSRGDTSAALDIFRSRVYVESCMFFQNTAQWCGAAAFVAQSSLLVHNSTFRGNVGNK